METNRKLIDYLPPFMQSYIEMQHIMSAEQPEIDDLWNASESILEEQFIMTATEHGVARWEKMIGVTPKDTDTLDERKFKILLKLNQELPYTMKKLEESLTTMCGAGNFSVDLQADKYHIEIKLALSNKNDYQEAVDLLTKMIPANLTQHVQVMYNSHEVLDDFLHAELFTYTHENLKAKVLEHVNIVKVTDNDGNITVTGIGIVITATDDDNGNVTVTGLNVVSDTNGNIKVKG